MRTWLIACVAALAVGSAAMAQQDASLAALEAARAEHGVPAMSAAVWRDGEVVWTASVGSADLELDVPATDATRYRLGSVSKVFTATLAAKLAAEGRIDLDRPLREWMPELPEHYDGVTLRLLLGHLGGVRHYYATDFAPMRAGGSIDTRWYASSAAMLALFINDPLVGAPGEKYSYTTFGYTLIGLAMEAAAGASFEDLLRDEVLTPLGLESVAVDSFRAIIPNRATPYDPPIADLGESVEDGVRNALPLNSAYKVPGGGLVATAVDVARFGGAHVDASFLGEAMFAEAFTPQTTASGEELRVGLGWRVFRDPAGRQVFSHGGSQQGCRSVVMVWPDADVSVAVLSNLTQTPRDIEALAAAVAAPFLANVPAPVGGD